MLSPHALILLFCSLGPRVFLAWQTDTVVLEDLYADPDSYLYPGRDAN